MKDNQEVIKRGILGYRNYPSDKKEFFKEDFEDTGTLQEFLDEIITGESDITELGKNVLLEMFDVSDLAQRILDNGGLREVDVTAANQIRNIVLRQEPHVVAAFISEARQKKEGDSNSKGI